jgi:PAS domain S-box-containing protein
MPPNSSDKAEIESALLAAIVASSEDAIASKTLDGIVTSWNAAAERLFGYSADEMIGQSIRKIIPSELQHEETEILAKIRSGQRIDRYETVRVSKDGSRIEISLTVSPVRDRSGHVVGAAKIAHDITRRRRAETQLQQLLAERQQLLDSERAARSEAERLSHMKDEFLATLSHELRTPLNAIQGWAMLLRQKHVSAEDRVRGLEAIERNVRTQVQIVSDLLDMSRIISGKIHLDVQPLQLHEIVTTALEAVGQSAQTKNLRITRVLDSSTGMVRGDPHRLQQVLWNLLTNAVKFTPKGGRIHVVMERVNSHVEIAVEDTGIGISPEFLPHVFDRFRQANAGTTREYGGLGLGLSIVKNLVELHGGSVRVKSPGENQGSTFIISLPVSHVQRDDALHSSHSAAASDPLGTVELPRLDNIKVLVVDDDPDGCALIARILEGRGAKATCAASAAEAIERLRQHRFDILLSDIGMPQTDGYELIRAARELDSSRSMAAIAVTAYARAQDRQRSLLAGYQMHLSKPIEAPELIAAISSLLKLRQ